ncbi:MAG: prepilin-type N-terminal cleavage/methylation domain-containing protein [Kiritimatiellae bacterium]|nr:prepilin-type N-terminal cleavage/methylation domain-containing protein [Kiritimatiellia bacterium]
MRRGFTLVELTLVLLVMAVTAHLAVREVSHVRDARLALAADRQLRDIRAASLAFLSDTGRCVVVTNGTLSELWKRPSDIPDYRVVPAVAGNIVAGADSRLANAGVMVPVGWRGPYLRLPPGKSRLFDPWGNPVEAVDAAGLPRIGTTNGVYAASACHYGPKGQAGAISAMSLLPERGGESSLTVWATGPNLSGGVRLAWYGPAGGMVTGAVATVAANAQHRFEGLVPGERIVTAGTEGEPARVVRLVDVRPGDNILEVVVP